MARLVYFAFPNGSVQGGQKMIIRHVETLRDLGFDAQWCIGADNVVPDWFTHKAHRFTDGELRKDDVLVLPDDAHDSLARTPALGMKSVVFAQNPYLMAALSMSALDGFAADAVPPFVAVAPGLAAVIRRLYPQARTEIVPCFADERVFRPGAERQAAVAYAPRKRQLEALAIRNLFPRLHPRHEAIPFRKIEKASEAQAAAAFGSSSFFLSLSRLESVGMTPLEAMASGALCAGFLGLGGEEYATADNGFWVADDDCVAAADALAEAADVVAAGGPELSRRLEAGYETARQWSYARFRVALEDVWMRLAPETRVKNGPLD